MSDWLIAALLVAGFVALVVIGLVIAERYGGTGR